MSHRTIPRFSFRMPACLELLDFAPPRPGDVAYSPLLWGWRGDPRLSQENRGIPSAHDIGRQKVGCFGFYERQLRGPCPTALVWSKRCLHETGRAAQAGISRLNGAVLPHHGIPENATGQAGQIPGIGSCGRGFLRLPRWLHHCCGSTSLLRVVG